MSQDVDTAADRIATGTAEDGAGERDTDETTPVPIDHTRRTDVGKHSRNPRSDMRRAVHWGMRHWAGLLVMVLLTASIASGADVYWLSFRPEQQVDAAVTKQVLEAASQGTVSTLSYNAETFDKDLAAAKARLTGEFLKYYSEFADQFVAPAVRQKNVNTTASVVKAAIVELHPDRAVVLLFVDQVTTSTDRPDPGSAASSVLVTLTRSRDGWLISEFNPI